MLAQPQSKGGRRAVARLLVVIGLALSAVAVAGRVLAADPAQVLKGSGDVVVCTWGGSYTDAQVSALFDPFTKLSGIKVTTTGTPDVARMKVMVDTGNVEWDMVDAEAQMMFKAVKQNLLQPIDYNLIQKIVPKEDLIQESLQEYGFPSIAFGWVLAWNTKTFAAGKAPQSWADFWDVEKFPGRRALYAQPKPLLEMALLADGVPIDKLYPIDLDRAFKKLDQIKKHVNVWYKDLGQVDALLQNGEVDMLLTSNGRAHAAKKAGFPVDYTFKEGAWEQGYWVVMKNAPNAENAMKLIAYTALPEGQAAFAKAFAYGGPNKKAYAMMDPQVAAGLPTAPQNLPGQFQIDAKWWTDHLEEVNRRWLEWFAAQ